MGDSLRPTAAPVAVHALRPWEEEQTFADALYDWMQRAPWLALSTAAHLLAFFVLMAVPWSTLQRPKETTFSASLEPEPIDEFVEEQPEPKPEELVEPLETTEPTLVEDIPTELQDPDAPTDDPTSPSEDPSPVNTPFDELAFAQVLGIGGGAGGKYGNRFGEGRGRGGSGGRTEPALRAGLRWLVAHQDADGKWDADEFMKHDPANDTCDGPGHATHDVGITGLALLALLGDGNTTHEGEHREAVVRGVAWLRETQDPDSGLFGERASHDFVYDHAIATVAMCEAYYFSRSPLLKRNAQVAVNYCVRARNPYGAWRYDVPAIGDSDTSVTGWMVLALTSARDAGLTVDQNAFDGALAWLDEVSDPSTGRCGYDSFGSLSSRTPANDRYPREKGEAMTAVALLSRCFLGEEPEHAPILTAHADLLRRTPPEWDPEGLGCDVYYWYYGTYAMFQMGGRHWKDWSRALERAVVGSQRTGGAAAGSWDPVGPWGHAGGRVYSTALSVLCLEAHFRYARVVGAR